MGNQIDNEDMEFAQDTFSEALAVTDKQWMPEIGNKAKALRVYEVTVKAKDGDVFICKHRDGDGINDYKGYKLHQLSPIQTEADLSDIHPVKVEVYRSKQCRFSGSPV